jgi:purine nucleoside phosphoramidase
LNKIIKEVIVVSTIFKKIIDKEIPANIVYEDEDFLAFYDINPQAKVHVLVIPKKEIRNLDAATEEDALLLGRLQLVIAKIARQLGIAEEGYRVITNINGNGGQEVFHIHYHILGGEKLPVTLK